MGFQGEDALEAFFYCNQNSNSLQSIPDGYETIPRLLQSRRVICIMLTIRVDTDKE